jgi:alkylation response protein AidB-like acyl-CoA dehydrogenase
VTADDPRLSKTVYEGMDGRHTADIAFAAYPLKAEDVLARGEGVNLAVARGQELGAVIVCVETVAAMGVLIEQTIQYLHARIQFDSPLAKLDVLRHKVAEMYVNYETVKALVASVVRGADAQTAEWRRKVSLAKLHAAEAGRFVAHAGIQLHGAMGMTEELPAARLARRILMAEFDYGTRLEHLSRLAVMPRP